MIKCPRCGELNWKRIKTCPANASNDVFECESCKYKRLRYEGTRFELPGDKKYETDNK